MPGPARPELALRLPEVSAEHLDAVLRAAAGRGHLEAIAVLASALGWVVARATVPAARPPVLGGIHLAIARGIIMHGQAEGRG